MPTFDFTCTACNTVFEKTLPFGSKTKPVCPQCKSKKTEKMISMPSIAFKGSGFYKTDSAPKAKTPSKPSNPSATTPEGVKAEPQPKPEPPSSSSPEKKPTPATTPDTPAKP